MATVTEYASAASGTSWTNPTNANADDGAYATYTIAAKNTTGNVNTLSNLGFDSSIPANSSINSVTLEVEHKVSTTGGIAFLESAVAISGTPGTYNSDSAEPTTDTARSYSMARPGGGSWTRADLLDGTFTVLLRARSGNNATSVVYSWDYARVLVDYSPPITGALAATESGSDTASIAGDVLIDGALAATESGGDTAALEGIVTTGGGPVSGALAATEAGADTAAISGDVLVSGALAAAESGADTASLAGDVLVQGALSAAESGADTASLAGAVLVSGALAAVETGQDTAALYGAMPPITGTLDATENGADVAAMAGSAQGGTSQEEILPIGLIPGKRYDADSYMARLLGPPLEVRLRRELQESLERAAQEQQPAPKVERKVKQAISKALSDEDRAAYLSAYTDVWLEFYGALLERAEIADQQEAQRQEIELIRLQRLDDEDGEALAALMLML